MENDAVPLVAGIAFNLKKGIDSDIPDIEAEYDSMDTINAIRNALNGMGLEVELLEADAGLIQKLMNTRVDIVFNIAEGIGGRGREAQVPAILDLLGIPYTGSDETTLCIALDKAITKRLLSSYGIKTPRYQLIDKVPFKLNRYMDFPLIIKPNAEGSGKGIAEAAVADDMNRLEEAVSRIVSVYRQPVLVEEYIPGREFTVGIVGNGKETVIFPPMEIAYKLEGRENRIYSYDVKRYFEKYVDTVCPADLDEKATRSMIRISGRIYEILGCKDFSRIDYRMSEDGTVYFLEINPLPGLAPGYSDLPLIAGFCGVDYNTLIKMIMNSSLKRHGKESLGSVVR